MAMEDVDIRQRGMNGLRHLLSVHHESLILPFQCLLDQRLL